MSLPDHLGKKLSIDEISLQEQLPKEDSLKVNEVTTDLSTDMPKKCGFRLKVR